MKWLEAFLKGVNAFSKIFKTLEKLGEIFGGNDKKGSTGGKKSEVYKAMNKEGQEKVNGLKKALDAARDSNNKPEAARVLRELSNVYIQQSRLMTNLDPKLKAEAKIISDNLRELANKVATNQDAIPRSTEVSQNNHNQDKTLDQVVTTKYVEASDNASQALSIENSNGKMYDLALKSFEENNGLDATPLDAFKFMVDHDVPSLKAKEVVLAHNPDEKDSLEANIDKYIDLFKMSKENSTEMASNNETKMIAKQDQLVA